MRSSLASNRLGGLLVLEVLAAGGDTRAVRATHDDTYTLLHRLRHDALQCAVMVQQRVAAGQQEAVGARLVQVEGQLDRLDAVHTQAPGLDHAFFTQAREHAEGAGAGDFELAQPLVTVEVLGDVVDPDDVQAVGLQAAQAVFDGAQGGVGAVVVDDAVAVTVLEQAALFAQFTGGRVFQFVEDDATDLGAEHVLVTWATDQGIAQAAFGKAGTVERGAVEVAHAVVPGRIDGSLHFVFRHVAEHVAQRCGTEAQWVGDKGFEVHVRIPDEGSWL